MRNSPVASAVFMVHPTTFGYDDQTAQTNAFQNRPAETSATVAERAATEFEAATQQLRDHGIEVVVFRDQPEPSKPNAVFPNNWLSTWPDGRVFLYPMATQSRRVERSPQALQQLAQSFELGQIIDLSRAEDEGKYLESTGAIIFDHAHKLAYAALSPRCDAQLFTDHVQSLGYEPIAFRAADQSGVAVYHTNVLMGVQSTTAVVCAEAISDPAERARVIDSLERTGHQVAIISQTQMNRFCGNVIELQNDRGRRYLLLSQTAHEAFTPDQRLLLGQDKTLLPVAIPTIEAVGGGSARCMVAEVFLPRRVASAVG
ncbi:MAG TPA: arginine deiminase-related protein [Candidatus Saccharimonadia bacterium]|nr:arginine deiminase-related protein [Candidatus Saccharimonadia bacterium]